MTLNNIEPALNSNVLELTYGCAGNETFAFNLIMLFFTLAVAVGGITLFYKKDEVFAKLDTKTVIIVFIVLIIGIAFVGVLGDNIAAYCPAAV